MHVAFTYDGKAKRAYVDGQLVGELAFSATPTDSTDALYFGARGATYGFVGALDEIRLYNRALSADEITKLYTNEGWDDPDGDGATNLEEYQSGTDPNDPTSTPESGTLFMF